CPAWSAPATVSAATPGVWNRSAGVWKHFLTWGANTGFSPMSCRRWPMSWKNNWPDLKTWRSTAGAWKAGFRKSSTAGGRQPASLGMPAGNPPGRFLTAPRCAWPNLAWIQPGLNLPWTGWTRSEEQTSELQSRFELVCRLLLEEVEL